MNITKDIIARTENWRTENKNPVKNYATEANAEKEAERVVAIVAAHFAVEERDVRYVTMFNEAWGRYQIAFDMNYIIATGKRGGYIGLIAQIGHMSY